MRHNSSSDSGQETEVARLTRELHEAQEQQTATAEVLKVISTSPSELQPLLEDVARSAARFCEANDVTIFELDGQYLHTAAHWGAIPQEIGVRFPCTRGSVNGRSVIDRKPVHVIDLQAEVEEFPEGSVFARRFGHRTIVSVPLLGEGTAVGTIVLRRTEVNPFTNKQITLLETFAAQAAIAIENARLLGELRERTGDLEESLRYQTATSNVLKTISRSSLDLQTMLDTLVETAASLCRADGAWMFRRQGELYHLVTVRGVSEEVREFARSHPIASDRSTVSGRVTLELRAVHIPDILQDPEYSYEARRNAGDRTLLGVPLLREGELLGVFVLTRARVEPFTNREIELVTTFADQAVIAMENVRLITETREALEQQTATADVLQVINSSPGNLVPVFDAILEQAHHLCGVAYGSLYAYEDGQLRAVTIRGYPQRLADLLRQPFRPLPDSPHARVVAEKRVIHIPDVLTEPLWNQDDRRRTVAIEQGIRTMLFVPLLKDDMLLGYFSATRREVRPFSDKEITLLQSFAAQAVIAMENARLLGELRERTSDLTRSVDELTATGDVLKIISRSSVDLETVLNTLVETVARLCRADQAAMFRRREDRYHMVASWGYSGEARQFTLAHPLAPDRGTLSGRVESERRAIHIPDILQDPEYTYKEGQKVGGFRTMLGIPLSREDTLIGIFAINRTHVEPFTAKEIELASTFADQAVIAIENARLFDELRERQTELRVTFDNMGDGVMMFDASARLAAWNRNLQEMLDLPDALLAKRPSIAELFHYLAERREFSSAEVEAELGRSLEDTSREMRYERTRPDGRVIEVRRNPVPGGGFVMIYADITERKRAEEQIRTARDAAEGALRELKAAQTSLIHAEKMASLGQLTAGIAHEIKNPLNFVNNFAGLSEELLEEFKEEAATALAFLDESKRAEIGETIDMLAGNLQKIAEHGRRADGIVKSMLAHSRGGSGERRSVDLNSLVEEALNLAYHAARAQDQNFNITMEREFDPALTPIELAPQDMTRVFLNLIGNGFYAAHKRSRETGSRPVLKVTTRELGSTVEVRIRDNGTGIAKENREKLFQPFFTTKPTGEGTGLGLSISYEIVTQQHGGTIKVDSEVGAFTEFIVRLPRNRHAAPEGRAT